MPLVPQFYRLGHWCSERLSDLPGVSWLITGRAGISNQVTAPKSSLSTLPCCFLNCQVTSCKHSTSRPPIWPSISTSAKWEELNHAWGPLLVPVSLIKSVCSGMDAACCRALRCTRSLGSGGWRLDLRPNTGWLGVQYCIWLPKGQNSLENLSPIWPTSDGLKLSSDLELVIIWSLFLKRLRNSHSISLETRFLSYFLYVLPTTGNGN